MDLEERTLDDSLQRRCAVCGARLTDAEIHAARESGPPFLCSVHVAEEVPMRQEDELAGDEPGPGDAPSPRPGGD
jgi:hypothetical protein